MFFWVYLAHTGSHTTTHTHTHARCHTNTHTHRQTFFTQTFLHRQVYTYTHINKQTHVISPIDLSEIQAHGDIHAIIYVYMHKYIHDHEFRHKRTGVCIQKRNYKRKRTDIRTYKYTHALKHPNTTDKTDT